MFDIGAWLDRAKARHNLASDYKLALVSGISQSSMNNYRSGKTMPDERAVAKLCELSGDDPLHVLACIQSMRAANDDAAELWRRMADKLKGGTLGLVLLGALLLCTYQPDAVSAPLYIMSNGFWACVVLVAIARAVYRWRRLQRNRPSVCVQLISNKL